MSDDAKTLDRERLNEILARQIPRPAAGLPVPLPKLGLTIHVRELDGEIHPKVMAYAAAPHVERAKAGDVGTDEAEDMVSDATARSYVATLRHCVVDAETGEPLFASYREAAAFIRTLDIADLQAIERGVAVTPPVGSVEEGKGS